jgi:hypothetical protein
MLLTISDFKQHVRSDIEGLIVDLQEVTGRAGMEEADAWRHSLPAVAELLSDPALDPFHVFFGGSGHASLEYQLPAASSWCDLILLGSKRGRASALVMELKHWIITSDLPGPAEGLMIRSGTTRLHPSRQVAGYTEYIRRFHSEVLERNATVNGCVFFTRTGRAEQYKLAPNHLLAANYPVFTTSTADVQDRFPAFATSLLAEPAETFARDFEHGRYRQDRGFVKQMGQQLLDPTKSPFVLLEKQDQAFLLCRERISQVLDGRDGATRKHVVIVHGPPGSGKSVVAAHLWATLVTDGTLKSGDVVITTTSASQNSNWIHLVEIAARTTGARGVIKKATSYHPVSTHAVGQLRKKHEDSLFQDASDWRNNLALLKSLRSYQTGAEDDAYLVSLVDEAHALINPEHKEGRGQFGFASTLGPQAYHIIRASRVSVFFMDRDQSFRQRENTAVDDIVQWAAEQGASVDQIDLSGAQFRCAGSKEYADWIEIIRSNTHPQIAARHAARWQRPRERHVASNEYAAVAEPQPKPYFSRSSGMQFQMAATPAEMEGVLRDWINSGYTARILSSYNRDWKTSESPDPHSLPSSLQDFEISYLDKGKKQIWSRPWNYVPAQSGDYSLFVQATIGSAMAKDPLCEVGCPYAVRGFDFDYVGILWGQDLVWRTDRWVVQPEHVFESGVAIATRLASREHDPHGPHRAALLHRVWQSYRILLTRALRGVVLYSEDEETRNYLIKAISA